MQEKDGNLDYKNIDAKGKIALVTISDIYFKDIVLHAAEAGAVAVIIYFAPELPIEGWTLGDHDERFYPNDCTIIRRR